MALMRRVDRVAAGAGQGQQLGGGDLAAGDQVGEGGGVVAEVLLGGHGGRLPIGTLPGTASAWKSPTGDHHLAVRGPPGRRARRRRPQRRPLRGRRPVRRGDARGGRAGRGHRRPVAVRRGRLAAGQRRRGGAVGRGGAQPPLPRPGRAPGRDPDALRAAWSRVEEAWAATFARVAAMPDGTVDVSVDGEWSFAQTLRHLVMATDTWLRQGHPRGRAAVPPPRPAQRRVRDGRLRHVGLHDPGAVVRRGARGAGRPGRDGARLPRDRHAGGAGRGPRNPWDPDHRMSVRECLHVVLNEEWEHHRFAVRDLDTLTG